jgi:hypothetical protein
MSLAPQKQYGVNLLYGCAIVSIQDQQRREIGILLSHFYTTLPAIILHAGSVEDFPKQL